jgi:hypothetical protein
MKRAKSKSKSPLLPDAALTGGAESRSQPESEMALRAATLEEIVRLTGKDPLVAFAEAACGKWECTGCNGTGYIERDSNQKTTEGTYTARTACARCQGTKREKVPATAMLNARYKLATFFYAPRKPVETSAAEGTPPQRCVVVEFVGPDGDEELERDIH